MAAAPSDPQKVKQEERPEKEARKKKRSEKEVRKRKPAAAATSQTQTVIDGTARPGMDAQKKDLEKRRLFRFQAALQILVLSIP